VIRPQHPLQSYCGASHRKNIDTPSPWRVVQNAA
jgi:hypothetical protein